MAHQRNRRIHSNLTANNHMNTWRTVKMAFVQLNIPVPIRNPVSMNKWSVYQKAKYWCHVIPYGYVLPNHYEFYIVRYEYFCVPFVNVFTACFSVWPVFIFLFVTKTIASLYKVLALIHIFTASIIPPIVSIRIALQSTHLLKILWHHEKAWDLSLAQTKNFAIYFLQEVHCTKEKENCWTAEWGFSTIFSSFSSGSVGTCILVNSNFEFQILKQFSDPEGRFLIADVKQGIGRPLYVFVFTKRIY